MFTTNPGFISSIEVHPGMSDYIVIITDVNLKAKSAKKKPHKVFHLFVFLPIFVGVVSLRRCICVAYV
jgi:hypothetical protein